jgi:alpha-aminoadipate carrier protein LysW
VVKCPECDAEMDLDEDEVEEGEILSCPECDVELEVTQIHPVHVIPLTEDDDDDDEEEEAEGETTEAVEEPGDLIEDEAE